MNDGGPAFPIAFQHENQDGSQSGQEWGGMSLRDYFAAKALNGMLANDEAMQQLMSKSDSGNLDRSARGCVADMAYRYADAMLKARDVT